MRKLFVRFAVVCFLLLMARPLPGQIQGGWVNTGNLNGTRESGVEVTLPSGKALVAGGTDGTSVLASAEIYDPTTGVWTDTGAMVTAREYPAGVVLKNGKVLVIGGVEANGSALVSVELYDPSTSKWSAAGTLAVARFAHTATLLQSGKVLVAGGCSTNPCSRYTGESELYDPVSNKWTTTGSTPARVARSASRLSPRPPEFKTEESC